MAPSVPALPARRSDDGIIIVVRLTPKSSGDAIIGVELTSDGPALKVKLRAVPEKGKANLAAIALLAKWLEQPKASIELIAGSKSRLKQFFVRGDAEALMGKLASCVDAL